MKLSLDSYAIADASQILTPALLIYPELVDANIRAVLRMVGYDPNRWRPHIKTAKLAAIVQRMIAHGISNFKCSTTLELATACQAGAGDVLLAIAVTGANARRTVELSQEYPASRVSALVENQEQAERWQGTGIGVFVDINSGMNRTGIDQGRVEAILQLVRRIGREFRGLHYYDGHVSGGDLGAREKQAHAGYDQLMKIVRALGNDGLEVRELVTSGTPAAPFGFNYPGFRDAGFVHRISPGTVVYNDFTSLEQLPDYGFAPAALVLSTVISHPTPESISCDAGHKSVSVDAGVPSCRALAHPNLEALKPSEEHLPFKGLLTEKLPVIGEKLYLLPRHVCPTVNNFDHALMIVNGRVESIEPVTARGHEHPLVLYAVSR